MKIDKLYQFNKITDSYKKNCVNDKKGISRKREVDKVEISNIGKTLSSMQLDEVKTNNIDKIERLKDEIKNGTYKVDTEKLSRSIIDTIKGDKI